jgi:hypothetical protein
VDHACNPSYSEERDLEGNSSKLAWANSSQDTISKKKKKPSQNRTRGMAQGVGLEFKSLYKKQIIKNNHFRAPETVQRCATN